MATARDVAAHILASKGVMEAMKLQKLVYYAQAWSLAWDGAPLFSEPIEAWDYGPVVPSVPWEHRHVTVGLESLLGANAAALSANERAVVDAVVAFYGEMSASTLSDLTHREEPWRKHYQALRPSPVIPQQALQAYYRAASGEKLHTFAPGYREGLMKFLDTSPEEYAEMFELAEDQSIEGLFRA